MVDEDVGLTITYNRLKDPACSEPRILELRALHKEMDRQVLLAYAESDPEGRWRDAEVRRSARAPTTTRRRSPPSRMR